MAININDIEQAYYVPGQPGIIDYVHPKTGHAAFSGDTLKELEARYPSIKLGSFEKCVEWSENYHRKPVTHSTEAQFWEMLEVLPPEDWHRYPEEESFKMMEYISGSITSIYACVDSSYYRLADSYTLPHTEIVKRCRAFAARRKESLE